MSLHFIVRIKLAQAQAQLKPERVDKIAFLAENL